jgi:hypothetical protein
MPAPPPPAPWIGLEEEVECEALSLVRLGSAAFAFGKFEGDVAIFGDSVA